MDAAHRAYDFARHHIAGRRFEEDGFPHDLWRAMGEDGLLGLGIPTAYGGGGLSAVGLVRVGEALVRGGLNLGIATSWLSHTAVAATLIARFGTPAQRDLYLPSIADGRLTASVSISEPEAGAHPKLLTTRADRVEGGFRLEGEKAFVTNGPIAGLYVVLAITAVEGGRKRYTAFLVPADTPRLSRTRAGVVDFLKPSPHCGLSLKGCVLGEDAVLGTPGAAFETMSLPLRTFEDVLGLGPLAGAIGAEVTLIGAAWRSHAAEGNVDDETAAAIGAVAADHMALLTLGVAAADALDGGDEGKADALTLSARRFAGDVQERISDLRAANPHIRTEALDAIADDATRMAGLAGRAARAKQARLGRAIITREAGEGR